MLHTLGFFFLSFLNSVVEEAKNFSLYKIDHNFDFTFSHPPITKFGVPAVYRCKIRNLKQIIYAKAD